MTREEFEFGGRFIQHLKEKGIVNEEGASELAKVFAIMLRDRPKKKDLEEMK